MANGAQEVPYAAGRHWPNIAVVGGNRAKEEEAGLAFALGQYLARMEAYVLCGGRTGVMEAVARGFQSAGPAKRGLIVGILPGADRTQANEWIDLVLPTGLGMLRNGLIARGCDLMIAIGGGAGTLSEITMAWHEGKAVALLGGGWADQFGGRCLDERQTEPMAAFASLAELEPWLQKQMTRARS